QLADVIPETIVDGSGMSFSVYVQDCPGCHNSQTHNFKGGYTVETDNIQQWTYFDNKTNIF
ncbi:MAG: anaerobic ribonucleoside-triphosphate reductase activating protein, partial [Oscillospiraceae bacterium]|nr:anaerobic ribonucleoside-triphosphate reductase activating protein [Oscillospiraceae bacterium]